MHRPRVNPFWSGLVAAILLLVLMTGVVVIGIPGGPQISVPWSHNVTMHVQLANSEALAPHASVEIAGIKVGEVQSVSANGNMAVATLQIQQRYSDIHSDATVYLRAHGLFGPKYISIVPGSAASPVVQDGGTISVNQTVQPVNLDAILQALQTPEQQDLRTTIVELGTAAAGRGDDVNHLLAAAQSLTKVLDSPLKAVGNVGPQLSDMLVNNEAFNNYFAQAPLDQLVANSETTFQAFAANAGHLESLLTNADSTLTQLDTALNGQPGNLASIIQQLGTPGGTVDKLNKFTYLLGLFGANLTGKEVALGTDPAAQNVTNGIIGAITSIASAFNYSDPCPATVGTPGSTNDNHCSVSPDGRQHYLDARVFNFPPTNNPNPTIFTNQGTAGSAQYAGDQLSSFGSLLAS
jgi:phospholipid/cholesterol/gamma-HCH transport system substrate-binding protein